MAPDLLSIAVSLFLVLFLVSECHRWYLVASVAQLRVVVRASRGDPVTGVLTRRAWEHDATAAYAHLRSPVVVYVDVNRLKQVNDTYGHYAGDELLAVLARQLRTAFGSQALLARVGGDEFVVLTDEATAGSDDGLARAVAGCAVTVGEIEAGAAFGVARSSAQARPVELAGLLRAADQALLRAKDHCQDTGSPITLAFDGAGEAVVDPRTDPPRHIPTRRQHRSSPRSQRRPH